jgi:hypothetical protein
MSNELKSICYPFKSEHAASLRAVGQELASKPLRSCKAHSCLVGLLLLNLADMIDEKFSRGNVVEFRPRQPEPPKPAA